MFTFSCKHSTSSKPENKLVIFAAASLRDALTKIGDDFKQAHPGTEIIFNFAGTQELRAQIEQGASVDVFASADQQHMQALTNASLLSTPVVFARNEPVVVVAKESASSIRSFSDLPTAMRIVVGTPEVPIGRYTFQILDRASSSIHADFRKRVEAKIVSRELNVRQVLAKVSMGEANAGIVYRTDVHTARDVSIVTIPPDVNVIAEYPMAITKNAPHPELARAWVDMVLSTEGQERLHEVGFLPPR